MSLGAILWDVTDREGIKAPDLQSSLHQRSYLTTIPPRANTSIVWSLWFHPPISPTSTMVSLGGGASLLGKGWRKRIFTTLVLNRKKEKRCVVLVSSKHLQGPTLDGDGAHHKYTFFHLFSMYH
jgi:hypothetical protein